MEIVNKAYRVIHTPLNNWQIVIFVSIVLSYLLICMAVTFIISPQVAMYMYWIFFGHVAVFLLIIKLIDYLYDKKVINV